MPRKLLQQHWGKPPGPDLNVAPFPFGVVAPTGNNGTSFPMMNKMGWINGWFSDIMIMDE